MPPLGIAQIIIFIGLFETVVWDGFNYSGDYGTGYFGKSLEGEEKVAKLNIELNNGRAAMVSVLGVRLCLRVSGVHLFLDRVPSMSTTSSLRTVNPYPNSDPRPWFVPTDGYPRCLC